jgi:hypothetical protein
MDFRLYARVLWRFRVIVAAGICLGFALSFLSVVRISFEGGKPALVYRQSKIWESEARLFVTQRGFPWGRTAPEYLPTTPENGAPAVPASDPGRLASLATLYAEFAKGDFVQSVVGVKRAPLVVVEPVPAPPLSSPPILPLISVRALGPTPATSAALARRTADALQAFVQRQQNDARIPEADRVRVEVLSQPNRSLLVKDRGKTVPLIVFLAVLIAACGLAFVLENFRPRLKPVYEPDGGVGDAEPRPAAEAPLRSA